MANREDEALALELSIEEKVTASFVQQVSRAVARILAVQNMSPDVIRRTALEALAGIKPSMSAEAASQLARAVELGRDHGRELVDVETVQSLPDPTMRSVAAGIDREARQDLDTALKLARTLSLTTAGDVAALVGATGQAAQRARGAARWVACRGVSLGIDEVATSAEVSLLWIPERNACLSCLAYAGRTRKPGDSFPGGLTFGDKPVNTKSLPRPPLHPNCRCRVEPYSGPSARRDLTGDALSTALRREAERSVLRGLTDFESTPAALRAANRLLKQGTALPKTVVARAMRDVRREKFTDRPVSRVM